MSELTFNIADYRPLFRARVQQHPPDPHPRGFLLVNSNSEPREHESRWFDPRAEVVDIGSIREVPRCSPRRGKILRFSNPASHRLYTMPAPEDRTSADDDPGPLVA